MKIAMICFTMAGAETANRIREQLQEYEVEVWCKKQSISDQIKIRKLEEPLKTWTGQVFHSCDALIFVGATGIAVRSIAPFLKSKTIDPAVLVVDEQARYVISLVSGHIGGANELCEKLAKRLRAIAVVTTATDLNGRFAVDVFAEKNDLYIRELPIAKMISAQLLDGKEVGFYSDVPVEGILPEGLVENSRAEHIPEYGICISADEEKQPFVHTLHLIPRKCVVGVGCRRGKSFEELQSFYLTTLAEAHISPHAVTAICSIDVKADEQGIIALSGNQGIPFHTYPAEELARVQGDFSASGFVSEKVGVDNVCERSAVLGSEQGSLIIEKKASSGMTMAAAWKNWRVSFE